MNTSSVYVLGAGFTRAFVPDAPLLVGDYGISGLQKKFTAFRHASDVLSRALKETSDGFVDFERLMTRTSGMPYDSTNARRELALLEVELKRSLVDRLTRAKAAGCDQDALDKFSRKLLESQSSVVTFNYDDILDEALWKAGMANTNERIWHPDGGYGFYCHPSRDCIADSPGHMDRCTTLVLKLHGSVNWRPRLGALASLNPRDIVHHETWSEESPDPRHALDRIESHLEREPFVVPPVLAKTELTTHPTLRVVWEVAHEKLSAASDVYFVGYSLPTTDLASRVLFSETLLSRVGVNIHVVSLAKSDSEAHDTMARYRSLFPELARSQFDLEGAKAWLEKLPSTGH